MSISITFVITVVISITIQDFDFVGWQSLTAIG